MTRHAGQNQPHTVEGRDPGLNVEVFRGDTDAGLPPILLVHGFSSSIDLNWVQSGWIRDLLKAGRWAIAVDLPGHGRSEAPADMDSYSPGKIRADLLQAVTDVGARPLRDGDPGSGLDVIGYSLGGRIGWEIAGTQRGLVRRAVLGGPSHNDPLAEFDVVAAQRHLADGTPIADASTAALLTMAQLVPSNNIFAFLQLIEAAKVEPFDPEDAVPHQDVLLAAGSEDPRAASLPTLAALVEEAGGHAETLLIPGRNHTNTVTSRVFKEAALEFLAR
ncbi:MULTISPECIES: alpha/beta fold hydrolase [Arthrobacter]|jgi:pimeloyl-ACP methyl ester carboxylesterase|uniref:Pimeloyl-ACP methyl ester carboxylesterase n=1 Tax=Arthrobacter woluwensis TaxID=156980 RepID=A0A1H4NBJ8_9MICC|nr:MULTISPECIES: alpha/beta fold hydrolase [Arthrobacter]QTF71939.1 alpha/beta hydrolase [Arthrobacter woluwensis]SEB92623.1 Pimeloyl-ACP methyl ester carboxylesterase [Arthrobacter woluwensis]